MERMLVVAWGPSVGFCASEEGGGDTEDVGCRVTRGETFLDILLFFKMRSTDPLIQPVNPNKE